MKKIICVMLILVMACGLCACTTVTEPHEETERIGYVIVPHADGEEHADIYDWSLNSGVVYAYCLDGRFIASPQIIVVLEP